MSTKVVGLDLGTHTIKVCELVTTFRNYELVGFGSEPVDATGGVASRPTMQAIAEAAHRLLERRGLLSETVICALPADYVSTVRLSFPFDQPRKIEQALPFQLEDAIPFDVEEVVYDYQVMDRRADGTTDVLVPYVRKDLFEAFLATLQGAGVDPKIVSVGALTPFNLYDHLLAAHGELGPVAVLDVGHVHAELAVFDGGIPVVVRNIPGGGLDVTRALAALFGVEAEQAERGKHAEGFVADLPKGFGLESDGVGQSRRELIGAACRDALVPMVREVKRSLASHFAATGREVQRVYVTGGGALLEDFTPWLEQQIGVPVGAYDPLAVPFNRLAADGDRLRPYLGKALALSLRGFHRGGGRQSQINFRKGPYAYTGDFGYLRGRLIAVGVSVLLMIVLSAMVAVSRKRVLEAEYQTLTAQVRSVSKVLLGEETDDVDRVFRVMMDAEASEARLVPQTSTFEMLAEISAQIDPDLKIDVDRFELDLEHKKLVMAGRTGSGGDVERIVEALQRTKCFSRQVAKDRVEKTMNEQTKFRITGTSSCG